MTTLRAREPRLHLPNVTMVVCSTLGIYWVGYRRCDTRCPLDIFGPPSHSKLTSNDDIITSGTGTMVLEWAPPRFVVPHQPLHQQPLCRGFLA